MSKTPLLKNPSNAAISLLEDKISNNWFLKAS